MVTEGTTLTIRDILKYIAIALVIVGSVVAFLALTGSFGNYAFCNMICVLKSEKGAFGLGVPFGNVCGC